MLRSDGAIAIDPIDETGFDTLLMAYDLTEADLPAATRAKVDKLWRGMAAGYLDAMDLNEGTAGSDPIFEEYKAPACAVQGNRHNLDSRQNKVWDATLLPLPVKLP